MKDDKLSNANSKRCKARFSQVVDCDQKNITAIKCTDSIRYEKQKAQPLEWSGFMKTETFLILNPMANLEQKIETSQSPDQFLKQIRQSERTTLMLMHNTVERIQNEVGRILTNEMGDPYPNYSDCYRLCSELVEYGFESEAYELLGEIGAMIQEMHGNLVHHHILNCRTGFPNYRHGIKVDAPTNHFRWQKIFIEDWKHKDGMVTITFCREDEKDSNGAIWYDAAIAIEDLIMFAQSTEMDWAIDVSQDHTGEVIEKESKYSVEALIENCIPQIVKAYIYAGEPIVNL